MKATAIAPSNIAFIKYWGKKDSILRLPANGSISMNLNNLQTTTTVNFSSEYKKDSITIDGKNVEKESQRVIKHLNRIKALTKNKQYAKVVSINNFPSSTGLSSSATGFAALTIAAVKAAEITLSEKELSILARQGSGSACRSIPDGFVEWLDGNTSDTSYAKSIFPPSHWDIVDIVAIVSSEKKEVSTTEGQERAESSPFFLTRISNMQQKIQLIKQLLKKKDFTLFGELIEAEALELHTIMLTSSPSLLYWLPNTVYIMRLIRAWRKEGLESYFTVNTGQDIHIIVEKKNEKKIVNKLKSLPEVKKIISNYPSNGARLTNKHLF